MERDRRIFQDYEGWEWKSFGTECDIGLHFIAFLGAIPSTGVGEFYVGDD